MKHKNCLKCNKQVSKNCKLGCCNKCRDRSGKNNPFYKKKHKRETIDKAKKKLSKVSKGLWKNKEYREKVIKGVSKPRVESFKKEQSERVKQWYKDNPEQLKIRSKKMKQSWKEGKIKPNINSINESKLEKELREEIKMLLPKSKVRKSTLKINNKWFYPDVKIDKDVIIEFYGNYWHANPKIYLENDIVHHNITAGEIWRNDKNRIKILKDAGFRVFIVWQDEYEQNKKLVLSNLVNNL